MTEKESLNLIIDEMEKIRDKYKRKDEKARSKITEAYVTYHGEKYMSERDILEAYACDMMTSSQADRLSERLEKKQKKTVESKWTLMLNILGNMIGNLREEVCDIEYKEARKVDMQDRYRAAFEARGVSYAEWLKEQEEAEIVTRQSEDYERLMGGN